jgi:glucose/mannose-6-phosphate isomerase
MKNIETIPEQYQESLTLGKGLKIKKPEKIVFVGMGGSGFAGDVIKCLAEEEIDIEVVKDYSLPLNLTKKDLVVVVSYSGNTEETLSCAKEAIERKIPIVGIGTGGELEELCSKFIKIPSGYQPRDAVAYLVIPILNVLKENNVLSVDGYDKIFFNQKEIKIVAKDISNKMIKEIPVIYSSTRLRCLAEGTKTRINENGKILAYSNVIPEMNHNEIVGFTEKVAELFILIIRDVEDHPRIKKRFEITKDIIEDHGFKCVILDTYGDSLISRVFNTLHIADWISYYLAEQYGYEPAPVEIIEDLKKKLLS